MQINAGGQVINKSTDRHKADKNKVCINEEIKALEVRTVDENGAQLGVLPTKTALEQARLRGYDLVEVSATAKPPVCKIMDYGKYKYEMSKKAHDAKKKQTVVVLKEIKFRPKIDEHDYQFKVRHALQFIAGGNKVKISVVFRGREMAYMDRGRKILDRIAQDVKDEAKVEYLPKVEGRNMFMILAPHKAG